MTDSTTLDIFRRAGAATVYEASGRIGCLDSEIRPVVASAVVSGRAFTVRCDHGDNLAVHRAVAEAEAGDILIVDGQSGAFGYVGDVLAEAALARGIAGVVVDGTVRDAAELRRMNFPAWSRGLCIRGASKTFPGELRCPVAVGGVVIRTGDLIVADDDGVCAVAAELVERTRAGTETRLAQEASMREALRSGALTLDLLDLRKYLVDTK
ncbi:4-carboxy-4-hydroxy-2-oxoadipate aldolase/oxaloacetate decarboxylase [Mesorhizobium sp. KR9-304]|uniref:4-carboxy-4-hydroxy-2-oxoadipate aldolase/oxaloacetate decarboxylase n=1 Tax=Mesorhizobium sp. KR9-304 TaxID=3156614 RepID=UPI0032B4784D